MKLEIDLVKESHEELLSRFPSLSSFFFLIERVMKESHYHNDGQECMRDASLKEIQYLRPAIEALHTAWRTEYLSRITSAQKELDLNPLTQYRYWDTAEKQFTGDTFVLCKKHLSRVHIPAGSTIQKVNDPENVDLECKFCEFEAAQRRPNK